MENQKLPIKVKISLAVGMWGTNLLILLNTYFLMYFYTDVVKIPSGAVSIILLAARLWDAINDPMMGAIVDRTASKEGKSRFWLKYFSVPAGIALFLSYFCPALDTPAKIAWVTVTYILQGMLATVMSVSTNALFARITDDPSQRVQITQMELVGNMLLTVIISSFTLPMVNSFGNGNMGTGFAVTVAIYSGIFIITKLISWSGTKSYDEMPAEASVPLLKKEQPQEKVSLMTLVRATLANKYALLVSVIYVFYLLTAAIMGSTMVYYFQYNLKNTGMMSLYSVSVMIGSVAGIACMGVINKKIGNSRGCAFCGLLVIIGCLIRFISGDSSMIIFVLSMVILGMGSGLVGSFSMQCALDACTWAKLKNGDSNQGMIMSVFTFAQKMGQALGGVVAAWLLTIVPYEAGAADQAQSVKTLFYVENIILPMIFATVIVFGFLYVCKYEKELNLIKQQQNESVLKGAVLKNE